MAGYVGSVKATKCKYMYVHVYFLISRQGEWKFKLLSLDSVKKQKIGGASESLWYENY